MDGDVEEHFERDGCAEDFGEGSGYGCEHCNGKYGAGDPFGGVLGGGFGEAESGGDAEMGDVVL